MTAPPRILHVNSRFNGGGTDNQTIELIAGLRDLGVEVSLSIPHGCCWEARGRALGVPLGQFPARSKLMLAAIRHWRSVIRQTRAQIVHIHQGRDYWPAIIAARLAGIGTRLVVTRHLMTRPRTVSRTLLLSFADVVAVSDAVLAVLQRELRGPKSRLRRVYGGIDVATFQPVRDAAALEVRRTHGWTDANVVFGLVGAFDFPDGKGQLELLEAARQLKPAFPQARFAIVGQGSMRDLLRTRISELGLDGMVAMIPFTEKIAPVLAALDVLTHPAVGTEALGLVLWEAMASGKPLIASRLDGIPEAFVEGQHGFLIPPRDAGALAEAIRVMLNDPGLRERFGTAGRQWVCDHFSREKFALRMCALYSEILERT